METINKTDYTDSAERIYLIIRNYVNIPVYETISSVSNYETVMQRSVIKSQIKFQRTSNSIIHTHIYIIYFEFSQEPSFIVHPNRRCLSLLDPTFQPGDNVANGHLFPVHSLFQEEEEEEDHSTHFISLADRQTVSPRFARLETRRLGS